MKVLFLKNEPSLFDTSGTMDENNLVSALFRDLGMRSEGADVDQSDVLYCWNNEEIYRGSVIDIIIQVKAQLIFYFGIIFLTFITSAIPLSLMHSTSVSNV